MRPTFYFDICCLAEFLYVENVNCFNCDCKGMQKQQGKVPYIRGRKWHEGIVFCDDSEFNNDFFTEYIGMNFNYLILQQCHESYLFEINKIITYMYQ